MQYAVKLRIGRIPPVPLVKRGSDLGLSTPHGLETGVPYHLLVHYNRRYGRRDCVDRGLASRAHGPGQESHRSSRRCASCPRHSAARFAEGRTWDEVCERAECSRGFVALWARRFRVERLAGLYSRHRGQKPFRCTPSVEAKILNATRKPPTDGSTHLSTRRLAGKLRGVAHDWWRGCGTSTGCSRTGWSAT